MLLFINVIVVVLKPLPVTCSSHTDQDEIGTVVCDIGNPLPAGTLVGPTSWQQQ